ncbi:MAG: hypothetical protein R6X06_05015 [Gammaproteobacteria bacterium]
MRYILLSCLLIFSTPALANEVSINNVRFTYTNGTWTVHVTVEHADTGWEHYADGWRVVDAEGNVLGSRTLYHPHVNEQPFTRSLSGLHIPENLDEVYVEAHDKVHGWSQDRVKVSLNDPAGERYQLDR